MLYLLIVVGALVCAVQAIRSSRLLISALWLAGCSALVALVMYLLGAAEVAVIELSVGAGLVTVLFVFAINIAGEEAVILKSIVPRPLAITLIVIAVALLGWLNLPVFNLGVLGPVGPEKFATIIWQDRSLDMMLQILLIFTGVLGMLGLLAEGKSHSH